MSFAAAALRMSAGVVVWALHFAAIYGLTALACARGWTSMVAPAIAAATGVALIAALAILVAGWRRRGEFEHWLSATVAAFALLAIVYEAVPVLLLPACG